MYREQICGHCGRNPSARFCDACGLWICQECSAKGCGLDTAAWTGRCKRCDTAYPDEQRRDVLDDGDGQLLCSRCGSGFRLRRLSLLDSEIATRLLASPMSCDVCPGPSERARQRLFVLEDHWVSRKRTQRICHLLCCCGDLCG